MGGLVGREWHGSSSRELPGLKVLAEGPMLAEHPKYGPHAAMIDDGPKGTVVFDAGTIWWAQGLSSPPGHVVPAHKHARPQGPDLRVQRRTGNLIQRFLA